MNDNVLIDLVSRNPVLFDLSHPKYMDSSLKTEVWNTVGRDMNSNGSICRKRWNNIRDQYRKNLKKYATSNKPKLYKYHDQLSFLKPYFADTELAGNSSCKEEESMKENENNDISFDQFSTINSPPGAAASPSQAPSRHSGSPSPDTLIPAHLRETDPLGTATLLEYLLRKNEAEKAKHPTDVFLEGISLTLKNLPPYYQNLAKSEIFSIVQKYELRMITDSAEQANDM